MVFILTFLLLGVIGAAIGFLGGLMGIGGGLLAIPFFVLALGYEQQAAQGTALIMVLPAVLSTLFNYHRLAPIPFKEALAGASTSVVFTWLGARLALGLDPVSLQRFYAGFILCMAVYYFYKSRNLGAAASARTPRENISLYYFMLIGMVSGTAGGVFAVGGSVVVVPLLTTFFHFSQFQAQALGLSMIVPGIVVALATYAYHGQVALFSGLPMAIGSLLLVPLGVRVAYGLAEARLRFIFAFTLLVIAFLLYFSTR